MQDTADLLQIKIEKAKSILPENTRNAINAVDWKAAILKMREKKGYTFEQLGDLELETELLLCGLLSPVNYPKELENRMGLSKTQVDELVREMNEQVFSKIKEELIKSTERKKAFAKNEKGETHEIPVTEVLDRAGIELVEPASTSDINKEKMVEGRETMLKKIEKPEPTPDIHPMLAQKLSGSFQIPSVKTEHAPENISSNSAPKATPRVDPYREIPE